MVELTAKQQRIVDIYVEWLEANHRPPTIRDLCVVLDVRSPNGVLNHLKALCRKGHMTLDSGHYRLAHYTLKVQRTITQTQAAPETVPATQQLVDNQP
jgi:SOS-response transcriptional repressor LexA